MRQRGEHGRRKAPEGPDAEASQTIRADARRKINMNAEDIIGTGRKQSPQKDTHTLPVSSATARIDAIYDAARGAIAGNNMLLDGIAIERAAKRVETAITELSGLAVPLSLGAGWNLSWVEIYVSARDGGAFPHLASRRPIAIIPAYERTPKHVIKQLADWKIPYVGINEELPILVAPAGTI